MRYGTVSTCRTSCDATDTFAGSAPRTASFSVFSTGTSPPDRLARVGKDALGQSHHVARASGTSGLPRRIQPVDATLALRGQRSIIR